MQYTIIPEKREPASTQIRLSEKDVDEIIRKHFTNLHPGCKINQVYFTEYDRLTSVTIFIEGEISDD